MKTNKYKRTFPAAILTALTLAALTACGGESGETTDSGVDNPDELTELTVGVLPVVDVAPIYLAEDMGFFEEHGLDVTMEVGQGGAAVVPAVMSGDYDLGFSNFSSQANAYSQGLPLYSVSPGVFSTGERGADNSAVVAMPETEIETPADLAGLTVATNTLSNNFVMAVAHAVEQDGGDPDLIDWVELAWPDMPAALENGNIDAGVVVEPFLTLAQDIGAEPVVWNWIEVDPNFLVAGYFTTTNFAEQNPDALERFIGALDEARIYADENPEEVRRITETFTEISEDVRERMILPRFGGEFNVEELQRQVDLAEKHGVTSGPVDVTEMILMD